MTRTLIALIAGALFLAGCATNEIHVQNNAAAGVTLVFRGVQYYVGSGGSADVTDIPNGTYVYSTQYIVPSSATKSTVVGDVAGDMTFQLNQTKYVLLYGSITTAGEYQINAVKSTSDPSGSSSPTAP